MSEPARTSVRLTDRMVLIALGIGAAYWIIECLLFVFMSYKISFLGRLFGPDLDGLSTRIVVICLLLIFGSHAQYTFNQKKRAEEELCSLKEANEQLQQEIEGLKSNTE